MEKYINISICIPALNEQESLEETVEDLMKTLAPHVRELDIIIVDDGSSDATPWIAEQLVKKYHQVRAIHHLKKTGIGSCYRDALALARGDYFTWFPGDHENSAQEFILCLPYLKNDTAVTCYHLGQDPRSCFRHLLSRSFTWLLNKFSRLNLKYYNGLTVFPTAVLRSLPLVADGFLFTAENLIKAIRRGYKVVELSAPLRGRLCGKSNALTLSAAFQIAKDTLKLIMSRK
ncbi:MAG: glycosyltransferase family 2 protein [Candidatus Omnitrophica bacterium]|nr:glycosyltransferase family 2 protein [Candidatus Omnitrophota bacterium]